MNATAVKFGYPDSVVKEFGHWIVQVRPAQPTLGSLVLICKDDAAHFGEISKDAGAELPQVVAKIEQVLGEAFAFERINYLMLMMVDPDVHFHVLPRYEQAQTFAGSVFTDPGWPAAPNIGHVNEIDEATREKLLEALRTAFV